MADIKLEREDGFAVLTLQRPDKHNALDPELLAKLIDVIEHLPDGIGSDDGTRRAVMPKQRPPGSDGDSGPDVLIITGSGSEAFCAGADLRLMSEMSQEDLHSFLVDTRKLFRTLAEVKIPTIAAVNGHAHGAGAEIACICDLRIGCPQTTFRFPGLAYGMAVGTWHLPSVVGLPKAKELLLTTDQVDAEEAMRIGLLNQLVPAAHLLDRARKMAGRIASHPGNQVRGVKSLLNRSVGSPLQQRFYRELYSNLEWRGTRDARELFRGFLSDSNGSSTPSTKVK
jgi:enoyl-CoA hydratase/carnithine racemase